MKTRSILMLSQDITLLLYPVTSRRRDLVLESFKHDYNIFKKIDDGDVTI